MKNKSLNGLFSLGLASLQYLTAQSVLAIEPSSPFIPKKIVAGADHTCVLSTSGKMKCWGSSNSGELGSGSTTEIGKRPDTMGSNLATIDLGKDVVVKDMCAGENFSCALTTVGRVKCWGDNDYGQLGQEIEDRSVGDKPNQMGDYLPWTNLGTDFVATDVQCGGQSACAINTKGQVKCWGSNYWGQLGLSIEDRKTFGTKVGEMGDKLPYLPIAPVKSIAASTHHTCAATSESVYCWGSNRYGEAGAELTNYSVQLPASAKDAVKVKLEDEGVATAIHSLSSGAQHICAEYSTQMPAKKKIKCWGNNNFGQLGIGSDEEVVGKKLATMGSKLPELQLDSSQFIQRETYGYFSCALKRNGTVQCWGLNSLGQLGLGDTANRGQNPDDLGTHLDHVDLGGLPVLALSHGPLSNSVCALFINHEVKCWGAATEGQLGYEDDVSRGSKPSDMGEHLPFVRYK